jgi:hypothetical protein
MRWKETVTTCMQHRITGEKLLTFIKKRSSANKKG